MTAGHPSLPHRQPSAPGTLVWLRRELRTHDLPALQAAVARGGPVVPVYVHGPDAEHGDWPPGAASRWWLHHSLVALQRETAALGSPLVVRAGDTVASLRRLLHDTGADRVHFTARAEPAAQTLEAAVLAALPARSFPGDELWSSAHIRTASGGPYRVFTPFSRRCLAAEAPTAPLTAPASLTPPATPAASVAIDRLGLLPTIPWDHGLAATWTPGAAAGRAALTRWITGETLARYDRGRDTPEGTSALSAHLAFGEISVRAAWWAVNQRLAVDGAASAGLMAWRRQLIWREFARHLLRHFPHTVSAPLQPRYDGFPWRRDPELLRRWQRGQTGFPYVDAAQRVLWHTGWTPNRARMVTASFLVKDGLVSWLEGARWFWDTLVDADLANNTLGWQWAGGCGADAAPFFRVFNPTTQGRRHDPTGAFIRAWVPELRDMPDVHDPWRKAPVLAAATGYATPVVDHAVARLRALDTWRSTAT